VVSRKRAASSIVHATPEPAPATLQQTLAYARVTGTPATSIMGEQMYDNWRRRTGRLLRAHRIASQAGDYDRARAIYRAYRRLSTGSIQ
jgi:hypothetical protein